MIFFLLVMLFHPSAYGTGEYLVLEVAAELICDSKTQKRFWFQKRFAISP